jgi:steroid delta-isomerase-like uncharacterized protein
MRGPLPGVHPFVANLFYTFTQAREELTAALDGLSGEEVWSRPYGLASIGFHVRHMGGAAERLGVYLRGGQLSEEQLKDMRAESDAGAGTEELLAGLRARQEQVEELVKQIDLAELTQPREVGRKRLPSTAIGLIVHIAEHTQRHLGQAITMAKLVRNVRTEIQAGPRSVVFSMTEPASVINRFIHEYQSTGDETAAEALLAKDFIDHTPFPGFGHTREDVKALFRVLRAAFPDLKAEVLEQFSQGDRVVTRKTFHGTHLGSFAGKPGSGKPVAIRVVDIVRVEGGQIREHWNVVDVDGFMAQLS